jgi:O-succinylbenzoic acid--CoA ligase
METSLSSVSPDCKADHLFLVSKTGSYTYQNLQCFGEAFIHFLKEHDCINITQPIGLCAQPSDELVFIIATCWKLGIPFVSFNPNAQPSLLGKQIQAIDPSIIISDSAKTDGLTDKKTIPIKELKCPDVLPKNSALKTGSYIQVTHHQPSRKFGYFFTSGTSNQPKIVPLKRRQMHAAAKSSAKNLKPATNECWLLCLPLHHIGGISVILRSLIYGSAIYRMDRFDEKETARHFSENKQVVAASLVPTMLNRLLDEPEFTIHKLFRAILLGGGPISPQLLRKSINQNIPVIPSYGMTETCAQIAANPIFEMPENEALLNSVGRVFNSNKIKIQNNDRSVHAGNSGTIWLKGPQVFDGYHFTSSQNNFDESGWFNTGDFGRLDKSGNLYIEARRADLIITGGENVSPFEVETALQKLDAVKEGAVFGVPDEEWGQKVAAAVVFEKGKKLSQQTLQKKLHNQLEYFKIPKKFVVVDALPRIDTGKIQRSKLAQLLNSTTVW